MINLTFYIRPFDLPLQYGVPLPVRRQMDVSVDGTRTVLDLLEGLGVRATFFVTSDFDAHAAAVVEQMRTNGHRVIMHDQPVPKVNYWRSLHNMPLALYVLPKDCGVVFQAWEFSEMAYNNELKLPFYMRRNSGLKMVRRLALAIDMWKTRNEIFEIIKEKTI